MRLRIQVGLEALQRWWPDKAGTAVTGAMRVRKMAKTAADTAHSKGQSDYQKSGGQANSNPITELFHPTYNPPSGHENEYKSGWDNAKKQDK